MQIKIITLFFLLLMGFVGTSSADYVSGLNAYNKANYLKALVEWLPLAEQGDPQAQLNIAGMYTKGYGVKVDDAKAIFWYTKAAKQGQPRAQYNLGVMYLIGTGIDKSIEDAKYWLHLAYDNGVAEAETLWNQNKLWNF